MGPLVWRYGTGGVSSPATGARSPARATTPTTSTTAPPPPPVPGSAANTAGLYTFNSMEDIFLTTASAKCVVRAFSQNRYTEGLY
jgi:hypothetical protein